MMKSSYFKRFKQEKDYMVVFYQKSMITFICSKDDLNVSGTSICVQLTSRH